LLDILARIFLTNLSGLRISHYSTAQQAGVARLGTNGEGIGMPLDTRKKQKYPTRSLVSIFYLEI
jgi:hypothetical protein